MSRTVYLNGAYIPEEDAKVSIFDRGFLFADGVYEVTSVLDGKLLDFDGHATRLARSLGELGMANPIEKDALLAVHRELVTRKRHYRWSDLPADHPRRRRPGFRLSRRGDAPDHRGCSPRPSRGWPTAPWRRRG